MKIPGIMLVTITAFLLAGCSPSVSSHGFSRTTNGTVYAYDVATVDNSDEPIILLSRTGGQGPNYAMTWKMSRGRLFVDGLPLPLHRVSAPTLIYKEAGALQTKEISHSGVWLPLFRKNGASAEELELVFNEIGHRK